MRKSFIFIGILIILASTLIVSSQSNVINLRDWVKVQIVSPVTDSGEVEVMSIDKEHFEIHEGDHYFVKSFISNTGGTGTSDYFSFTAPVGATRIHAKALMSPDTDNIITIYEGGIITDGVNIIGINNDRNSNNTAELVVVAVPTIVDLGDIIWRARNGGGRNPVGVSPRLNYEIIARENTTYIFEVTKQTTADSIVDVNFWWYEEHN
jgi:hypothetical protein